MKNIQLLKQYSSVSLDKSSFEGSVQNKVISLFYEAGKQKP
jgi:hypothetical protein